MSEIRCTKCGKSDCHPLARIGGRAYCLFHFRMEMPEFQYYADRSGFLEPLGLALHHALELQTAARNIESGDSDTDRRELASDILDDIKFHIPFLEREFYGLAQSLLPANLQTPRECVHCGRTGTADESDWPFWDLCGGEECGARDAGIGIMGEE
jgi:hypothetical protein